MKIGIDISQLAFEGTGVAQYLQSLVISLIKNDTKNEYLLFYSSLRRKLPKSIIIKLTDTRVKIKQYNYPPILLDLLWNRFHILPIEYFIGDIDIFISSDWTQPPTKKAAKLTILYDLIIYKFPEETAEKIINTQKSRLKWVKKECDKIICISESTKNDAMEILGIEEDKLSVVHPGI